MKLTLPFHTDLLDTQKLVYGNDYTYTSAIADAQSTEYAACKFELNGLHIVFRTAKITPTKTGQFVTLWKRSPSGVTEPYAIMDPAALYVICTRKGNQFGQFVFPKAALQQQGILSANGMGGKRGFRVYPPWDETSNLQARKTQSWQADYFLEIPVNGMLNLNRRNQLYNYQP